MAIGAPATRTAIVLVALCASGWKAYAQAGVEMPAVIPQPPVSTGSTLGQAEQGKEQDKIYPHSKDRGRELNGPDRPLPALPAMMQDVETNQRKSEAVEKNYIYHTVVTRQETDSHGSAKKTTVDEYDTYWVNGVRVGRLMRKNGRDLSVDEIAKENERIDKETVKAHERRERADAQGKPTDPRGNDEVTVSRLIELGSFTNARRVQLNGRDTIAVDYTGDPKAKTRNRAEDVIRDLQGTAWIDEQDHVLARAEGHFANAFKIGGGLLVNIQKDTHFAMEQTKVNGEVWLPEHIDAQGAARAMLFMSFSGSVHIVDSEYRKFRTTSTVLPGVSTVAPTDPGTEATH